VDDKEFKTRSSRLEQIAKVLEKLPPEIRGEAFELLKGYVTEHSPGPRTKTEDTKSQPKTDAQSKEEFFGSFPHDKPADNVKLIAAWFYREYGAEPFTLDEVRAEADAVGITIPARVDMTLSQAKDEGKKLFARAGKGKFKPTVHGESYLKARYSVKKGTKKRTENAE
jgi:hypothetical protein